jgi:hypothetical protein
MYEDYCKTDKLEPCESPRNPTTTDAVKRMAKWLD